MPRHGIGFLRRFGLKTGTHFAHFGLYSGMVFEGSTESRNVFSSILQFQMSKKERKTCEFEMDLNNFFSLPR